MANSYSRYGVFISGSTMLTIPSIPVPPGDEDVFIPYDSNSTRMDRLAAEYYGDDSYWWIIMMANPEYYFEFDIPSGAIIRVPLPLDSVIANFQQTAQNYIG